MNVKANMLTGLRVLDLTDEKGFFCGLILSRLGADVVKVEKPGGDTARQRGPFFHDIPDPEKSLYWFAYNVGKRGITLNLELLQGRDILKRLAQKADFIIESFPVGYLDRIGLGYQEMKKVNPRVILTSITPFGQNGTYRNYKSCDIVAMATGGMMALCGEPEKAPLRLNPDHAYCLTGTNAALATLLANYNRQMVSGQGQHVDVSMHDCTVRENNMWVYRYEFERTVPKRSGGLVVYAITTRQVFKCKDGYVLYAFGIGPFWLRENKGLAQWLRDENIPGVMQEINWDTYKFAPDSQIIIDVIMEQVITLAARHTKKELTDEAIRREVRLSPVNNIEDICNSEQLARRNYWIKVDHPELGTSINYPGHLFMSNEVQAGIEHRPPFIGESNNDIYGQELGFSQKQLAELRHSGVI